MSMEQISAGGPLAEHRRSKARISGEVAEQTETVLSPSRKVYSENKGATSGG